MRPSEALVARHSEALREEAKDQHSVPAHKEDEDKEDEDESGMRRGRCCYCCC
jgi:hypothetical protein